MCAELADERIKNNVIETEYAETKERQEIAFRVEKRFSFETMRKLRELKILFEKAVYSHNLTVEQLRESKIRLIEEKKKNCKLMCKLTTSD